MRLDCYLQWRSGSFVGSDMQSNPSWWQLDKTKGMVQAGSVPYLKWRTKPTVLWRERLKPDLAYSCNTTQSHAPTEPCLDFQFGCVTSRNGDRSQDSIGETIGAFMAIVKRHLIGEIFKLQHSRQSTIRSHIQCHQRWIGRHPVAEA